MRTNRKQRGEIRPENRKLVAKLAEKHNKWLSIVRKLDKNYQFPEDVVSEFYEQTLYYGTPKMLNDDGEVNEAYTYISLRNAFLKTLKSDSKINTTRLKEQHLAIAEETDEEKEAFGRVCEIIEDEMSTWDWHEQQLFDTYFTSGMSLRQMGEELGASWTSIYYILRHSKEKIRDVLLEDYRDYINGDYDLIKGIEKLNEEQDEQ